MRLRFYSLIVLAAFAPAPALADVLVASFFSDNIIRLDANGQHVATLSGGPAFGGPLCARVGPDGLLYVAAEGADAIYRYDLSTNTYVDTFISSGSGGLDSPTGLCWGPDGRLYVGSFTNSNVLRYDGASGAFVDTFVTTGLGGLSGADNGMTFGPDGNLWVPSYNNNRVIRYHGTTGASLGLIGGSIGRPRVLVFRNNSLYLTSESSNSVRRYSLEGAFLGTFIASGSGGLGVPVGLAFDEAANVAYVGSSVNDRVLRYNATTGAFIDVFAAAPGLPIDGPVFVTVVPEPGAGVSAVTAVVFWRRRRRGRAPRERAGARQGLAVRAAWRSLVVPRITPNTRLSSPAPSRYRRILG